MFSWEKGTEIAIWGTGRRARKFYLRYRHYFKVKFFIDNHPKENRLDQIDIILPRQLTDRKIKIVVAIDNYKEVCSQCKGFGMSFFDDYLPYDLIDFDSVDLIKLWDLLEESEMEEAFHKIAGHKPFSILMGNCQIPVIKKILLSSRQFREQYFILDVPLIHVITHKDLDMIEKCTFVFRECSLYITQYINSDNSFAPFYATENIRKIANKRGEFIVIPVLYLDLYFPQTSQNKWVNSLLNEVGVLSFAYGDCILDELSKNYSIEDIVDIVCMDHLFSDRFLQWMYDTRLEEIRNREAHCDVKIYDYIIKNFRKEQLFYSKNHPCKKVFVEFGKRLLDRMGFHDEAVEQIRIPELDEYQEILYPSVASYYGLCFDKTLYRDPVVDEECELKEIIRLYISTTHGYKRI